MADAWGPPPHPPWPPSDHGGNAGVAAFFKFASISSWLRRRLTGSLPPEFKFKLWPEALSLAVLRVPLRGPQV